VKDLSNGNNVKHPCMTMSVSGTIILQQFDGSLTCADRICEQCGEDHDFRPKFDDTRTSIDIIPDLLDPRKNSDLKAVHVIKRRQLT
jgi:hypothetical protein